MQWIGVGAFPLCNTVIRLTIYEQKYHLNFLCMQWSQIAGWLEDWGYIYPVLQTGAIPTLPKSSQSVCQLYLYPHSLEFSSFLYNISPLWLDPFHHSAPCGNTTWMPSLICPVFPSVPSLSSHAQAPESLFSFSLLLSVPFLAGTFDLSFVGLSSLGR